MSLAIASDQTPLVDRYRCGLSDQVQQDNVAQVHVAYLQRSISLVSAAVRGDESALAEIVAPNARFTVIRGDVGTGPRSTGPQAAVSFFQGLALTNYQYLAPGAGPFSMQPCGPISSELLLSRSDSGGAAALEFKFDGGLLVEVTGSGTSIFEGEIGGSSING
jgi:hypothetical protein